MTAPRSILISNFGEVKTRMHSLSLDVNKGKLAAVFDQEWGSPLQFRGFLYYVVLGLFYLDL